MDKFAIRTVNLTKEFNGLVAVNELNLTIKLGELFSFLGPNGAGKTTTINMLCCLLRPTRGTAEILGYDILKHPFKVKELIGVCPQETAISENLNAWENLSLIARLHGLNDKEIRRRAGELLQKMGLAERAKEPVKRFSSGMKRRLNLIMALIHNPPVLFFDEPTLGLDPQARRALWDYVEELKGEKTILLTTHYMEEADFLSHRIGIIDQGKIVALDTPQGLKSQFSEIKVLRLATAQLTAAAINGLKREYQVEIEERGLKVWGEALDFKRIIDHLHSHGVIVNSAALEEPSLEEVFLKITGKELRE